MSGEKEVEPKQNENNFGKNQFVGTNNNNLKLWFFDEKFLNNKGQKNLTSRWAGHCYTQIYN